jgi:hypothetical protein
MTATAAAPDRAKRSAIGLWTTAILSVGVLVRLAAIFREYNQDWEHDPFNHVIFAQSVFAELPGSLAYGIVIWAKPLYTYFFACVYQLLPAAWPALVITQVVNTLLWTAAVALTLSVARALFRYRQTLLLLAVVGAFTFVGFRSSVSANTEPLGAFVVALALWLWHRRRMLAAAFCFGLVVLVRMDSVFFVSVFALAAVLEPFRQRASHWLGTAVLRGLVFVLPTALWNLAGFAVTGRLFYLLTDGYPITTLGEYGHIGPDYLLTFLLFDTVLTVAFAAGAWRVLRHPRDSEPLLLTCAAMGVIYFVAMTAIWTLGAFGSAGYIRYFVFAYPVYILVAGVAFDRWFMHLSESRSAAAVNRVAALLSLAVLLQLHWFAHGNIWIFYNSTRIPPSDLWRIADLPIDWRTRAVYTDVPDVDYYLGHNRIYFERHPLTEIRNPDAHGVFVFTRQWSETYSPGVAQNFATLHPVATLDGPDGEVAEIYER